MKQFTYISDILKDKQFKIFLDDAIDEVTHQHNCSLILVQSHGLVLSRNTFDHLELKGLLTVDELTGEFALIEAGISKQPAKVRAFISSIVDEQIMKTLEYYKVNRIVRFCKRLFNRKS